MNIKQKIQELSLDQKAKLYFMGLVRQGKIDRLPDDPKAAYVDMLYKDLANVGKDTDDYGRSVSGKDKRTFMEPEDLMPAARARKLSGMEDDDMETRYDYDDPIMEGDTYEKMAAKGKKAGNLKQGTVRKRLRIKDGEKIPLARINKAISSLKKRKSLNDKDKKYLKALNLAKTLKTTTNVKEIATELGYLNEYGEYKSQEEKFKQELDSMFKDYRPFISLGKYAGERPDSDPLKGKGFGSLDFVVPRELPPNEFTKALDWVKSKGFEVKSQSNEYEVEYDGDRAYYPKIKFHFDVDKFDTE